MILPTVKTFEHLITFLMYSHGNSFFLAMLGGCFVFPFLSIHCSNSHLQNTVLAQNGYRLTCYIGWLSSSEAELTAQKPWDQVWALHHWKLPSIFQNPLSQGRERNECASSDSPSYKNLGTCLDQPPGAKQALHFKSARCIPKFQGLMSLL